MVRQEPVERLAVRVFVPTHRDDRNGATTSPKARSLDDFYR
jgi:hypothetical protein